MSDLGHRLTDKELLKLERRIWSVYNDASKDMDKTVQEYFTSFTARDQEMHQLVLDGKWDERKYKQWRLAQIGRGQRFEAMRDKLAAQATEANERAIAYVNSAMPNIYALNRNYAAYTIEQASKAADFTLYDEGTVLRLLAENPATMPYYPQKRAIDRGIDLAYGQRQITATVTSGILRGNSIKKIADELQNYIVDMSRTSAIRSARTAVTSAQNGGRQASYDAAEKMGVVVQKEWMATKDSRTRIEHGMADGQIVDKDKPFIVGGEELMFPGDTSAHGWNVYNCRCTMRAVIPDSPYQKRETYKEWMDRKEAEREEKEVVKSPERQTETPKVEKKNYIDITDSWYSDATPGSHEVKDLMEYTAPDGKKYVVHGTDVVLDYSPHEKEIAEFLERKVGGEIYMVPRVNKPAGVPTPDYLFHGKGYDLKTIGPGATKNTLFNRVKKASKQASNMIVDITQSGLDDNTISSQIEKIYWSNNTLFVDELVIITGEDIKKVVKRK